MKCPQCGRIAKDLHMYDGERMCYACVCEMRACDGEQKYKPVKKEIHRARKKKEVE